MWTGLNRLIIVSTVYSSETSGSVIEGGSCIDQLSDSKFLKNDPAPMGLVFSLMTIFCRVIPLFRNV
jgi:hypothetical protein